MTAAWSESSIPRPLTSLIGREHEVSALATALTHDATRLLTITGAGGVGKSRIALEVAHRVAGNFPFGVRLVEAASLTDPALLLPVLARALDLPHLADTSSIVSLANAVGDRSQ